MFIGHSAQSTAYLAVDHTLLPIPAPISSSPSRSSRALLQLLGLPTHTTTYPTLIYLFPPSHFSHAPHWFEQGM